MGAENSDSNPVNVNNFQRRKSVNIGEVQNLPTLRRHVNTLEDNKLSATPIHTSMGLGARKDCPQKFTRRASENYCIDFRNQYSNGIMQNAILRKFSGSIQNA